MQGQRASHEASSPHKKDARPKAKPRDAARVESTQKTSKPKTRHAGAAVIRKRGEANNCCRGTSRRRRRVRTENRRGQLLSHETPQALSPPKKEARLKAEPRDAAGVESTQKTSKSKTRHTGAVVIRKRGEASNCCRATRRVSPHQSLPSSHF